MCSLVIYLRSSILFIFFFNDTPTTELYTLSPTRRSSDLARRSRHRSLRRQCRAVWRSPSQRTMPIATPLGIAAAYAIDRKSTRLNSSHVEISYAVFCLKKKKKYNYTLSIKTKKQHRHAQL